CAREHRERQWATCRDKMGRSAHHAALPGSHTRARVGDHETFMGEISAVLETSPRDRALLERTLTDGYAHALSLEAERRRVLKELRALAATVEGGDVGRKTKELADLARRIERQDVMLAQLRDPLVRLRSQYVATSEPAAPRRSR